MGINVSGSDVISQIGMILQVLGPIYAIFFGLLGARYLLENTVNKIFPPKLKTKTKKPRQSVKYDKKQYPGLRAYKTKQGLTISWYDNNPVRK